MFITDLDFFRQPSRLHLLHHRHANIKLVGGHTGLFGTQRKQTTFAALHRLVRVRPQVPRRCEIGLANVQGRIVQKLERDARFAGRSVAFAFFIQVDAVHQEFEQEEVFGGDLIHGLKH